MSAYVVDANHIAYLIEAAEHLSRVVNRAGNFSWWDGAKCKYLNQDVTKTELGQLLWNENVASVSYRYEDDSPDDLPGPIGAWPYLYAHPNKPYGEINPVQVIKACHCYSCQSCEHPGWEESEAKRIIDELVSDATGSLPGYDDAVWGAPEPFNWQPTRAA